MDLSLAWPVTLFTWWFSKPAALGTVTDVARMHNACARPAVLHISVRRFSSLCFPKGTLQNQTSVEWKELALWFFGFCQRVSHHGSLFAKYFSRQATGQQGFPGQGIITD